MKILDILFQWMQHATVVDKSNCDVGIVEGFSSSKFKYMVAIWYSYNHISRVSRRSSALILENLQVSIVNVLILQ